VTDAEAIRPALTRLFEKVGFHPPPSWADTPKNHSAHAQPLPSWLVDHQPPPRDKSRQEREGALNEIRKFLDVEEALGGRGTPDGEEATPVNASGADAAPDTNKCEGAEPDPILQGVKMVPTEGQEAHDNSNAPQNAETEPAKVTDADALTESAQLLLRLGALSEDQLERLGRLLKLSKNGLPSREGDLWYETLLELARDAWDLHGKRLRFRKRYAARQVEPSMFNNRSPGAVGTRVKLLAALDRRFESITKRSKLSLSDALGLAALDLVLVSRIGCADMVLNILQDDTRCRVVRLGDRFFVEWSPSPSDNLFDKPSTPIQRFSLSVRCAWLLNNFVRGKGRRKGLWDRTQILCEINAEGGRALAVDNEETEGMATDPTSTLRDIAAIVDQANAVELPGAVAAYLSQRVRAASLPWGDWVRLHCTEWVVPRDRSSAEGAAGAPLEQRLQLEELPDDTEEDFELIAQTYFRTEEHPTQGAKRSDDRAAAGHALVAKVRKLIASIAESKDKSMRRNAAADKISLEVKSSGSKVSTAIQLLCLWAVDLLLRPGRSRKLASSSALRYFGALSPRFTAMGYEVALENLDAEDIESFYGDVLDGAKVKDQADVYAALRNFHAFASVAAGVDEIDWSSIIFTGCIELGSPGFIDEATYLLLLDRLPAVAQAWGVSAHQLISFAVLAYRFGLRGGEIEGLGRDDLIYPGNPARVIVRGNRARALKSRAGRRVVPQVFELTLAERAALEALLDMHSVDSIERQNAPLFLSPQDPLRPADGPRIRAIINAELKILTGQPHASMHKLRKSFASSLWLLLEAPQLTLNGVQTIEGGTRSALMVRLLGTPEQATTRRSGWAVAKLLGHAHPSTALRAYLPVLADVAASLVRIEESHSKLETGDVTVPALEHDLARHIPRPVGSHNPADHFSAIDMLRAMLFLGRGKSPSSTALRLNLPLDTVDDLERDAQAIYEKLIRGDELRLRQHSDDPQSRRLASQGLLSLVHIRAHERLRPMLASVTSRLPTTLSGLVDVSHEDLVAMVGARRQISMWDERHFSLAAYAARLMVTDWTRLVLEAPQGLRDTLMLSQLEALAASASWIPADSSGSHFETALPPLCPGLVFAQALPRVTLMGKGFDVQRRLSLRLSGSSRHKADAERGGWPGVGDSLEFVVGLICANSLARWHRVQNSSLVST